MSTSRSQHPPWGCITVTFATVAFWAALIFTIAKLT